MKKEVKTFIAPASIFRRIIAFLIDLFIINFVIIWPFNILLKRIIPLGGGYAATRVYLEQNPDIMSLIFILFSMIAILIVIYFSIFGYKLQQTPGRMIMKIWIVPERKITFWNYLFSNLTFLPFFPFYLLWIVDPIYMIRSPKNQRFMERFNKILVVQKYKY